ncbi:hypothetical protein [Nocardia carnea]|uniref:hypothetical protein n=1 Tax=Nocardia carnea TaxID=37328 RepID=UPI00245526A9|nr:hypothetical protein [Nocardia carnea]
MKWEDMTFRAKLEVCAAIHGRSAYWCRSLPTAEGLRWAFSEHERFPADEDYFPGPVHRLAAGLAAAHYRLAGAGAILDNVLDTWANAERELAELRYQLDCEVAALVPEPLPTASEYHESFGAFISRLAYLWVRTSPPPYGLGYRGGPGKELREQYFAEFIVPDGTYSVLVCNLDRQLVRLPSFGEGI